LVVAPADVDQIRRRAVGRILRVDLSVSRLVAPGHAALVVGGTARSQILTEDRRVTCTIRYVCEARAPVDAHGAALRWVGGCGAAEVQAAEERMVVAQGEDAPGLRIEQNPAVAWTQPGLDDHA